jgi:hypothetical protein
MALKRTKLLGIQNVTGINTVGILTVGVTQTAGGVGIASTTFLRGVVMHNTGLSTCQTSLYIYDDGESEGSGAAITTRRIARVDLSANETFFFETPYPITMTDGSQLFVEVSTPAAEVGGAGIGSMVNVQVLGDTDIV